MLDEIMWPGIEAGYRRLEADLAAAAADEYPEYNS
jgi:hypothetical protein